MRIAILAGFLVLATTSVGEAQPKKLPIVRHNDIVFGNGGGEKLKLDIALPKNAKGALPTIVCIHGGGWKAGNRKQLSFLIKWIAQRGYVAATISYRLAPKHRFPAQVHDCKAAVRWLRANAKKYHIDPERIGAVGFSAGGHLVCMLGAADKRAKLEGEGGNPKQSSRVQAVISFFGPTDFIKKTWSAGIEKTYFIPFFGVAYEKNSKPYAQASPIKYVSKDDPPFLFIHGDKDTLVQIYHSQVMRKALAKVGVSARLITMKGAGHGWFDNRLMQSFNDSMQFFDEKLKK